MPLMALRCAADSLLHGVISDEEIGSPCIDKADTVIVMNGPSYEKFQSRIKKKGPIDY